MQKINEAKTSTYEEWLYAIDEDYLVDEKTLITKLLTTFEPNWLNATYYRRCADELIKSIKEKTASKGGFDALLRHYDLSTQEGVILMCLAEAMLRIPDNDTVDELIADKLAAAEWEVHLGQSDSLFVNASTWALLLSGQLVANKGQPSSWFKKLVNRLDAPLLRGAIKQAMGMIAEQFVMGTDIEAALKRAEQWPECRYSYDMLGEAALTSADVERYQLAYLQAINVIGKTDNKQQLIHQRTSISVKLSALYPRYEYKKRAIAVEVVASKLLVLAEAAKSQGIGLTVDAEEADRLTLSLQIFKQVYLNSSLDGWPGLGLAVQAYQKRALAVLKYLQELSSQTGRRIPVRLVKGAYWDAEIKSAQQLGLKDYPVFTRKHNTDISYLACAQFLLSHYQYLYPQFATHNAYTVAMILENAGEAEFEFQRLHGMGELLYQVLSRDHALQSRYGCISCRVYAPVGAHQELLPYLVRRLLENGANSSFVNQMAKRANMQAELELSSVFNFSDACRNTNIPLPPAIFGAARQNSEGLNIASCIELNRLKHDIDRSCEGLFEAKARVNGRLVEGQEQIVVSPNDQRMVLGICYSLTLDSKHVFEDALSSAAASWKSWRERSVKERAGLLRKAADLLELNRTELIYLCVHEAGKTIPDSLAEVREAVDFLRYYAYQAENLMAEPQIMPTVTGESNQLRLQGKGIFLCISPWNFPIAIYTGQIAAALVTGNCVLAKPASSASLVASKVANLFFEAGVPKEVFHFLPATSDAVSEILLSDKRLSGVAFTGSGQAARLINRQLAERDGSLATLIAETGGQNALIADSSAQPEQLVKDVIYSAFNSAGQRCSALRVLYVEDNIAEHVIELLKGSISELLVGKSNDIAIDVGPVISSEAQTQLQAHINHWQQQGAVIHQGDLAGSLQGGHFVVPALIELESIRQLNKEHFGPVLHLIRFTWQDIDSVIEDINATGFALTFGFHSRIDARVRYLEQRIDAGNVYINRDIVGAVVGSQPFGGSGLSGTGPKAGGPHYLLRFTSEQTLTINTAAIGGNQALINSDDS